MSGPPIFFAMEAFGANFYLISSPKISKCKQLNFALWAVHQNYVQSTLGMNINLNQFHVIGIQIMYSI